MSIFAFLGLIIAVLSLGSAVGTIYVMMSERFSYRQEKASAYLTLTMMAMTIISALSI